MRGGIFWFRVVLGCFGFFSWAETPLSEWMNQRHPQKIRLEQAIADLDHLETQILKMYGYRGFYEKRHGISFEKWVALKRKELAFYAQEDELFLYDAVAILVETINIFRDPHTNLFSPEHKPPLISDSAATLNFFAFYHEGRDEFLIYRANQEVYRQLGVSSFEEFQRQHYVLKSFAGVEMGTLVEWMSPGLSWNDPATRRRLAGLLLGSSRGLVYLAHLMKKHPQLRLRAEGVDMEVECKNTGVTSIVRVTPQELGGHWPLTDPLTAVEGRSIDSKITEYTPEAVAKAMDFSFEEWGDKTFYLRAPTWTVEAEKAPEARAALYEFIHSAVGRLDGSPEANLILDVRGNRGGNTIFWRPIVERVMADKAVVTGLLQLDPELLTLYPKLRNRSVESILENPKDYVDTAYFAHDEEMPSSVRRPLMLKRDELVHRGILSRFDHLEMNWYFSRLLYSVLVRPRALPPFHGRVYVVIDGFGFSATDGMIGALRAALGDRVTFVGEATEGGSGSAREFVLPHTRMIGRTTSFLSFDSQGRLYEQDFNQPTPGYQFKIPMQAFFSRDEWVRSQLRNIILRDRLLKSPRRQNRADPCERALRK